MNDDEKYLFKENNMNKNLRKYYEKNNEVLIKEIHLKKNKRNNN
jgi:hypothetical protein